MGLPQDGTQIMTAVCKQRRLIGRFDSARRAQFLDAIFSIAKVLGEHFVCVLADVMRCAILRVRWLTVNMKWCCRDAHRAGDELTHGRAARQRWQG